MRYLLMTKDDLLKSIAEAGYNVGFGAKKHFATYDIVEKIPGLINFISIVFGIYALIFDSLSAKFLSASLIILGIIGLYILLYDIKKGDYEKSGKELTQLYNDLNKLYKHAKNAEVHELSNLENQLIEIEGKFYEYSQSKQILFSDWYAHYKFFWQHQIDWVDEQKRFRLLRDKLPLTFSLVITMVFFIIVAQFGLLSKVCTFIK